MVSELEQILTEARDIQDMAMIDEVTIDRSRGIITDRATGEDREQWETVYAGRARLPRADASTRVIVTGETITPAQPTVLIPWNAPEVRPDDRVTCHGRVLWVTDTSPRTFQSARHLTCREAR